MFRSHGAGFLERMVRGGTVAAKGAEGLSPNSEGLP